MGWDQLSRASSYKSTARSIVASPFFHRIKNGRVLGHDVHLLLNVYSSRSSIRPSFPLLNTGTPWSLCRMISHQPEATLSRTLEFKGLDSIAPLQVGSPDWSCTVTGCHHSTAKVTPQQHHARRVQVPIVLLPIDPRVAQQLLQTLVPSPVEAAAAGHTIGLGPGPSATRRNPCLPPTTQYNLDYQHSDRIRKTTLAPMSMMEPRPVTGARVYHHHHRVAMETRRRCHQASTDTIRYRAHQSHQSPHPGRQEQPTHQHFATLSSSASLTRLANSTTTSESWRISRPT